MSLIQTTLQPISRCVNNDGQIPDVPKNPRQINETEFEELKESIRSFPKMLELRECVAYEYDNQLVVLGGNMRLRACKDLGMKEVPVKIMPVDYFTKKELREFAIKDNVSKGKMDWDAYFNLWDTEEGKEWGVKSWDADNEMQNNLDIESPEISNELSLTFKLSEDEHRFVITVLQKKDANKEFALLKLVGYEL